MKGKVKPMEEMIRVLQVRPGIEEPKLIEIQNRLEAFQDKVGGHIEAVRPFDDNVLVIVNEEGKLWHLPMTRVLTVRNIAADVLVGCVLIAGEKGEDFGSLTDEQAAKYTELFRNWYIEATGWAE